MPRVSRYSCGLIGPSVIGVAGADLLAVLDEQLGVVRDRVLALDDVLGPDDEAVVALDEEARDRRGDVGRGAVGLDAGDDLAELDDVAGGGQQLGALRQGRARCRRPRGW